MKNHSTSSTHFLEKSIRNKLVVQTPSSLKDHSRFITGYDTIFHSTVKSKKQFLESQLSVRRLRIITRKLIYLG